MKQVSVDAIDRLIPWGVLGFGLNIVTGMLFFIAVPQQYTQSVAFFWKAGLIVVAAFNGLYFTAFDQTWAMEPGGDARFCPRRWPCPRSCCGWASCITGACCRSSALLPDVCSGCTIPLQGAGCRL
jgi:hypothetical protein